MTNSSTKTVHVGRAWRVILHDIGLDQVAVLRRAGLPSNLFDGDGSEISVDDFYALHEAVEAESGDSSLALRAGQVMSVELFDPAFFAAMCSPDFDAAADRLGQFKRLVGPFTLDVDRGAAETVVTFRCKYRPDVTRARGLVEVVFLVAFVRRATRHRVVPKRVTVQRLPADVEPYASFLGCALQRGKHWSVALAAEDARRPFLTHDERMWESFEPGLRRRMSEANESRSATDQVESALFELLPSGRTRLTEVAKEVGIGSRTLQRRLADEGTSWLEVLNRTREKLARHYLENTEMAPAQVAFLLGFEDSNSLFRAFHRWTGTTPESWRARLRN